MKPETIIQIDARGLSCPQPALLIRQTISKLTSGRLEVLVDAETQRENVIRVGQKAGWICTADMTANGSYRILIKK